MKWSSARISRRRRVLVLVLINLVVAFIVFGEALQFAAPRQSEAPASIVKLSMQVRSMMLQPGDRAPDFRMITLDAARIVTLRDLLGDKPIVLAFGSHSCPYFRAHMHALRQLHPKFQSGAQFYLVYIREAHPAEDGHIPENDALSPIPAHRTIQDRAKAAATCSALLELQMPVLVDDLDNTVARAYQAWPERVYVIDRNGRVAYAGAHAGDVKVEEIEATLERLTGDRSAQP